MTKKKISNAELTQFMKKTLDVAELSGIFLTVMLRLFGLEYVISSLLIPSLILSVDNWLCFLFIGTAVHGAVTNKAA